MEESESATDELRIARHRIQRNDLASRPRMKLVSGLCEYGSRYARLVRRGTIEGLALILAVFFALGNLLLSAVRLISQLLRSIILKLFTPSPSVYSAEKPIHPRLSQFHEDRDSGRRSTITEPSITHRIVFSIWTGLKQLLHHCCRLLGFLCFLVPLLLLLAFLFAPVAIDDDTAADIKPFPSDLQCSRSVVDVLPSDANIWRTAWWRFRCLYYHYILTPPETYQKTTENIGSLASLWTILTHWWTQPRSNGSRTPPLPKFPTYVEHKLMEQLTQFSNMVNQRLELLTENLRSTDARVTGITEQSTLNTKALNNQMLQLQQQLNVYAYELKQWQSEWQVYHTAKRVSRPGVGDLVTDYQSLMNSTVNAINQTVLLQFDSLRAELRDDQSGYWKQNEESLSKLSTLLSNLRFQLTFRIRQTEHELEQLRSQLRSHLEKRTTSDQDAFTVVSELKSSINKLEKQYLTLHKTGLESESIARSAHEAVLQCNAQLLEGREDCRRAVSEQFESGISNLTDQLTAQITDLVEDAFLKQMHSKLSDSEWIYRVKQTATQVARESVEKALAERIDVHFEASDRLMNMSDIDTIQSLIDVALQRFAADRTGMADFALESAGGAVVGTRCTKTYTDGSALFSIFGIPLARLSNSPRTILQPGNNPGECWPFHGSTGQAVIRLSAPVLISAVSLEHLPRSLAPNERLDSAPKDFIIKGLDSEDDEEGIILGNFTYNINGPSIQTFSVHNQTEPRQYIEFAVLSNHGHPLYTCVYRLRVHGTMPE
ncbi:SUN domain-containing protein 2 [Fasciola hepatica]|uniref:SUN domain-containing protein 2 n=1 Tax=Fasciola hepatica TaxID=6192 RepID=A0A4E0QYL7_FASHE|nr:SUN domain-containing protein 2 [Fasciola hepatica]